MGNSHLPGIYSYYRKLCSALHTSGKHSMYIYDFQQKRIFWNRFIGYWVHLCSAFLRTMMFNIDHVFMSINTDTDYVNNPENLPQIFETCDWVWPHRFQTLASDTPLWAIFNLTPPPYPHTYTLCVQTANNLLSFYLTLWCKLKY